MRKYTDIRVQQAAVHVVAPKQRRLRQSAAAIDLDEAVSEFLVAHVEKSLADGKALAGRFKVTGADRTEGLCRRMIASNSKFVPTSAQVAKHLYESSFKESADSRISDGALIVARCSATDGAAGTVTFVALLKLDPNAAFRAEDGVNAAGEAVIRLVEQDDILPTPRERLQKAAFIRPAGQEFDLLAVDHQRRGDLISDFFLDSFLGAEVVFDAKTRTTELYRTLRRTFDEVKADLSSNEYARVDQYINGQVVGGRVNVDTIVDGIPAKEAVKERFSAALDEALPDREFDTDSETADKLVKKRRFNGDNGLNVTVDSSFYPDMVTSTPPTEPGGQWTIIIRTRQWTER